MRKTAALIALTTCGVSTSASAGAPSPAAVRLVDRDPVTLRGEGFEPRERVRVTLSAPESARKVLRANANGAFRVIFPDLTAHRCNMVRAVVVGNAAGRVILKILPSPACAPLRSP